MVADLAYHGCLPGLGQGVLSNTDPAFFSRSSKSLQQLLRCHPKHGDDVKSCGGNRLPSSRVMQLNSLVFSFGIADQCTRHEKISNLLALASLDNDEDGLLLQRLSRLSDSILDPLHSPFAAYPTWCFTDAESPQSLVYPVTKLYFNEPSSSSDFRDNGMMQNVDCKSIIGSDQMEDMLSVIADLYKPSECPMVVPYFQWQKRVQSSTGLSKLTTEKAVPLKGSENRTGKTRQKRKSNKEKEIYGNSYLHACETLLSVIVDRKQHDKSAILSVKRACPQLPQLLIQIAATIAGAGIAVVLSVACKIGCGKASMMCASKALSASLGLGLIWLSFGIVKLRSTIVCIAKCWGKTGGNESEVMDRLDGNLKEIYLQSVALAAAMILRFA